MNRLRPQPVPVMKMKMAMMEDSISSDELGYATGIDLTLISRIVNGWRKPTKKQADKIDRALKRRDIFDRIPPHTMRKVLSRHPVSDVLTRSPDSWALDWGIVVRYEDGRPTHHENSMTLKEAVYHRNKYFRKKSCTSAYIIYIPPECRKCK